MHTSMQMCMYAYVHMYIHLLLSEIFFELSPELRSIVVEIQCLISMCMCMFVCTYVVWARSCSVSAHMQKMGKYAYIGASICSGVIQRDRLTNTYRHVRTHIHTYQGTHVHIKFGVRTHIHTYQGTHVHIGFGVGSGTYIRGQDTYQ